MLQGKKVLITGLTGRIGLMIAARFAPQCDLWGLARFTPEGSMERARAMGVTPVKGDFSRGQLDDVPTDFDYVLHVAANILATTPEEAMTDNSDGPALLMKHCRNAKAFLHVSAGGVYKENPDPWFLKKETDPLGGVYGGHYAPSKLAGEGAVRAACLILDLPTVICRQQVQYGGDLVPGGLVDRFIDHFIETGGEVFLPPEGPLIINPIYEDDICDLVEPSLGIASVPASILNWASDENVDWQEMFEYIGALLDTAPRFVRNPAFDFPHSATDVTKRRAVAGPTKVTWKDGVRRQIALRHPGVKMRELA